MYNIETSVSVQHELLPRVSVSGGWFHRDFKNLRRRDNILQSFADYTPFTLFSPDRRHTDHVLQREQCGA